MTGGGLVPKQPAESSKTMNTKTGKKMGKAFSAKATAAPAQHAVRRGRRIVTRGGKRPLNAPAGEAPFLASKVTARSQTTLPSGVRKALGLRAGDQITYEIEKDQVIIRKVTAEEEDPALDGFLDLLGDDIARNKERVVFATEGFANYLEELTAGIEVDYDAPIEGDFKL